MTAAEKRNTLVFIGSQTLSLAGSSLVQFAIIWHITLTTKSGVMMTAAIICGFVPIFLLSPFAGVWADRFDRKKLIILADGGIALATLAMALVYLAGFESVTLLLALMAVRGIGQAVHEPAVGAILPQMVPPEALTRVNAVKGSIQATVALLTPVLSGALLAVAPIRLIFLIDVATAALAILILTFWLKVPPHAKAVAPATTAWFHDLAEGVRYLRAHPYLIPFFIYIGLLAFLISPAAFLTPLQTTRSFGPEVWRLTAIEVFFSGGMMAGGALMAFRGGLRNRMATIAAATVVMALCTIGLALTPSFAIYLGIMGLFGVAMPFYHTPATVLLQEHVAEEYLGRVFSILSMISTSVMPLAMLVFGPLADLMRIESLLLATGIALLILGCGVFGYRRLMEAGRR